MSGSPVFATAAEGGCGGGESYQFSVKEESREKVIESMLAV
jgi:hypothetical protein